jgi:hypothetical protein
MYLKDYLVRMGQMDCNDQMNNLDQIDKLANRSIQ